MKKGIILLGKSGCGKTTILKYIDENFRYNNLVSTTTRPIRDGEKEGIDYYFVDAETFQKMFDDGQFLEVAKHGSHHYGLTKHEVDDQDYGVVIVNQEGLGILMEIYRDIFTSFYIYLDEKERLIRQIRRGDHIRDIARRYEVDERLFEHTSQISDYVINTDFDRSVEDIVVAIMKKLD